MARPGQVDRPPTPAAQGSLVTDATPIPGSGSPLAQATEPLPRTLEAVFASAWRRAAGDAATPSGPVTDGAAHFFELAPWRPWLADAWRLLDTAEQARALRKRRQADRDDVVLAYALHRLALATTLECPPASVRLARDALGRPVLDCEGMATSLSHAGGAVGVAVAAPGPLGIDLEPATRAAVMPELADRIWHPDEAARFAAVRGGDAGPALLRAWVCKEAVLKAAGIGLAREMSDFAAWPGRSVPLPREHGGEGPETVRVHMLDIGPDWVAAVAGAGDVAPVTAWLHPVPA